MQKLDLVEANVLAAYREGDESFKKGLEKMFPKFNFNPDIRELVGSYEAACELDGINPLKLSDFDFLPEQDREYHYADHQMTVIRRVLNEGWTWRPGEYGYYPVFNRSQAAGGPGFSCRDYDCDGSSSAVGARRTFKNSDLAEYAGKQFLSIQSIIHNEKEN